MRTLPSYAQTALVCNRSVWLAYIRNDWLDVAPSYPVPDGGAWHCAREVNEYSPENRDALRKTTHLCGWPAPRSIQCNERACLVPGSTPTPACASTCSLAEHNFSCGSSKDPCAGCSSEWAIPTLCETVRDRAHFCASTEAGVPPLPPSLLFHTAHCTPWSSLPMLREFRVLVLNAGAHRVPVEAYRFKMRKMANVIRGYLEQNREGVAVFRATVPGFSGCNETHDAPPHASVAIAEDYLEGHPFFEQHAFVPIANRIAADEVARVGGRYLDVYPSSILRLDDRAGTHTYNGGIDCLHYRYPLLSTSMLSWAQMLGESLSHPMS